jgi:acyl dehydratase
MMTTLYYHDLEIGKVYRSAGRTATEADNTMFCMLSGDWNPIHANADYAAETRFGQRVIPGLFGVSLITGAMGQWGIFEESILAMLNLKDWEFKAPIFIGDTIYVEMEILDKRLTSKGDTGIVGRRFTLVTHEGKLLQTGCSDMMIRVGPAES